MERAIHTIFLVTIFLIIIFPASLLAEKPRTAASDSDLATADALLIKGDVESIKKGLDLFENAASASPDSYEANWKCARAHFVLAETYRQQNVEGWKDMCATYGKAGYGYGEKAIALNPDLIEGNLYYGLCVWKYSDGVSILRALKEGLKGSTQAAFEKSYEIDKQFDNGWPMKALGRFWHQLPWPLRDYDKSLNYLNEHHQYFQNDPECLVFLAETLIDLNEKQKAKPFLDKAAQQEVDLFYQNLARQIIAQEY